MIEPYQAIGLVPTMRGIRHRDEIRVNIEHISHLIKAASWLSSLDLPVRLIAIPEGALQGFNDEVLDLDHETFARECAIDVPGPETDALGALARQWNVFLMGQAKARHPEFPGRFFNVGFVLSPDGDVILRHHKVVPLLPVEHSVTPHNVWDKWIELYGRNLDAFYPVADTEIGRLGFLMANEGSYPENARGLAMNGAEVVYRGPYPHPHVGNGLFEVQNRARALDNNFYLIACNVGTYYLHTDSDVPIDTFGGGSAVIDYRGQIIGRHDYSAGSSWVAGTIDVGALRKFRAGAQWDNWIKDLTTEQYQLIYEEPIYPKNLYLDRAPYTHGEYRREVIDRQIELMHEVHGQVLAVAGVLEAAVRHLGHDRDVGVDPHRAEVQALGHPHGAAVVLCPHARGQPVLDTVGPPDRLVLVGEPLDGDDRAEDLVLDHLVVLLQPGDDGGGVQVAALPHPVAAGHDLGVRRPAPDHALDPGQLVRVVQGAEVGVGHVEPAGRGVVGLLGQRRGQVGSDARPGQDPRRRGAVLPGVEVAGPGDALRGGRHVGVVEHDDRRLATQFEVHSLEVVGGRAGHLHAGPHRTGDRHHARRGV